MELGRHALLSRGWGVRDKRSVMPPGFRLWATGVDHHINHCAIANRSVEVRVLPLQPENPGPDLSVPRSWIFPDPGFNSVIFCVSDPVKLYHRTFKKQTVPELSLACAAQRFTRIFYRIIYQEWGIT